MKDDIEKKWRNFMGKHGASAYGKVDKFLTNLEKRYKKKKIKEFEKKGASHPVAINKARQSWVVYVGDRLERVIRFVVEPLVNKRGVKIARDKDIQRSKLSVELDSVRRNLLVHFNSYSYLPDADLIVYRYNKRNKKANVLAILSVKNSFRERYTETPYWKLKLGQSKITEGIRVFMITTDRDSEISSGKRPSKARVVLEYELDGVYITKHKSEFDSTKKIGNLKDLMNDLTSLLR